MTLALFGIYLVIGLVLARLIIGSQPDEQTRGGAAVAAAVVITLCWPAAIALALVMAVRAIFKRAPRD